MNELLVLANPERAATFKLGLSRTSELSLGPLNGSGSTSWSQGDDSSSSAFRPLPDRGARTTAERPRFSTGRWRPVRLKAWISLGFSLRLRSLCSSGPLAPPARRRIAVATEATAADVEKLLAEVQQSDMRQ